MYKKLFKILVICLLFGVLFFPDSSFAFKSITRNQLIYDAIDFSPTELQAYLRDHILIVTSGSHFAERHRRRSYTVDPYATETIYKQLVEDLNAGKYDEFNTAHAFGVIACFIAETISPDNHKTAQHLIPYEVSFDGYHEVEDVKSNINGLIADYRIPGRHRMSKEVTEVLYNAAVNEIVDYWVTAWVSSGHQAGQFAATGKTISHRIVVVKSKSIEGHSN